MNIEPDIQKLREMMLSSGARSLYVKRLSPNDNSKNQPYLGGDFSSLSILPFDHIHSETLGKRPNFKASIDFYWLLNDGSLAHAKNSKLILYPKYPEVRFSGFLLGCRDAPSDLMNSRDNGRLLFFGTTNDGRVIGYITSSETILAKSFNALGKLSTVGVFEEIPLQTTSENNTKILLDELSRIHKLGWIKSKKLVGPGEFGPCEAPNCGGMTLEAELGVMPNGFSEPDFHGWEVKQHTVNNYEKPNTGNITLMTPEPSAGIYKDLGVEAFVRQYGYKDKLGRPDRLNFGGIHKIDSENASTYLTMVLEGYDTKTGKITDTSGGIILKDRKGLSAAEWKFTDIFSHWKKKHAKAVYVPSEKIQSPLQYRYGNLIRLGVGTDPLKLLEAMSKQVIYYDPGIKLENASTSKPKTKRRSQFRIHVKNLPSLYHDMKQVDLLDIK